MAVKKTSRKKAARKASSKRAATTKRTAKKAARGGKSLAKRAKSAVSKVSRKTKQVARGAQKVGKIMGVIGGLVEAGGKAAEDITTKIESGKASGRSREPLSQGARKTRKKG